MATTWAAIPVRARPVPWVLVAMAPLMVWYAMSPRLGNANPRPFSNRFRSAMVMPASTVTVEAVRSTAINRLSRLMSIMAPVVADVAVKLCPLPRAFTVV